MGQSYGHRRIFLPTFYCLDFSKYGHILGQTICSGPRRRPGRQAHGGTGLAPRHHVRCPWDFLGLINTSRTSLVRNNERYSAFYPAVSQAFRFTFSTGIDQEPAELLSRLTESTAVWWTHHTFLRRSLWIKFSKVGSYFHFLWVILTAEGLTRRMGPLSSIMQVGNLVNLSIHLADF